MTVKGDQVHAPAHCLIDAAQARLVVPDNEQLELRAVLEEILAHEPGGNGIAAGERFDLALGPAAAFFRLLRRHQTSTAQARELCRVSITL